MPIKVSSRALALEHYNFENNINKLKYNTWANKRKKKKECANKLMRMTSKMHSSINSTLIHKLVKLISQQRRQVSVLNTAYFYKIH